MNALRLRAALRKGGWNRAAQNLPGAVAKAFERNAVPFSRFDGGTELSITVDPESGGLLACLADDGRRVASEDGPVVYRGQVQEPSSPPTGKALVAFKMDEALRKRLAKAAAVYPGGTSGVCRDALRVWLAAKGL